MDNTIQPHSFWEENVQHIKFESANSIEELQRLRDDRTLFTCCDGNLNFSTAPCSEDETDYSNIPYKKNKASRQDPMSHRIIEKRRRDRMNNCLADLSRLIPAEYLKKGRGRIEKTEIIEMAIKYMKHLQQLHTKLTENYSLGYQECMSETMHFLVEVEGRFPREAICVRLLNHLQKHSDALSQTQQTKAKEPSPDVCSDDPVYLSRISSNLDSKLQVDEPKSSEESNNNSYHISDENMNTGCSDLDTFDKQSDNGSASYKYKTNIKLRFSQDLNSAAKRQKNDNSDVYHSNRRTSVTSLENYSSSHSSPPSSGGEIVRGSTENEKIVRAYQKSNTKMLPTRHTSTDVNQLQDKMADHKSNFNVPIFVLHAKGSFYVPLTIDYYTLVPFLQNYNLLDIHTNMQNLVLHPVTINVNFQCNNVVKK